MYATVRKVADNEVWARASKAVTAAAVILDDQQRVLLVKHSYGQLNWELPGGAAEPDETPTQTALRELREETGLVVSAERLTGIYYERHSAGGEVLHFVFRCRPPEEGAVPRPSSPEITACGYWAVDALPRPMSTFTELRIRDALRPPGALLPVAIGPRQWLG